MANRSHAIILVNNRSTPVRVTVGSEEIIVPPNDQATTDTESTTIELPTGTSGTLDPSDYNVFTFDESHTQAVVPV